MSEQRTGSDPTAPHAVPSDQPPSAVPGPGPAGATGETPDEASRQAAETVRSISRLEESN